MGSFNPLFVILKEYKITGPNYIDWKRNFDIVLTTEYKFVVLCPDEPGERKTEQEVQDHQRWKKANEMAWCYILASMSNVLQNQHELMPTTYDMIMNLKEMFGDQSHVAWQVTMKDMMNTSMHEGAQSKRSYSEDDGSF